VKDEKKDGKDKPGKANRRASRPPAVASAMAQGVNTRGDTGGLTRPISMGSPMPMGPLPPGGFGAAPRYNPTTGRPWQRGQPGIGGSSVGGYDGQTAPGRGGTDKAYDGRRHPREHDHGHDGKHWIAGAIKHPGAFTAKAKRAGKSVAEYAQEEKGASGTTGKQARLAITLRGMHKK